MRVKRSLLVAALLVVLIVGLMVSGCGTGPTAEVQLRHTFAAGDTWTYEMTMVMNGSMSGPGMTAADEGAIPQDMTTKVRETVTVDDVTDGVATITVKTEILEATAEGQPMDMGESTTQQVTMRMDETGKVLSIDGLDDAGAAAGIFESGIPFDPSQFSDQLGVLFPEDGLGEVGDEWSATTTFPIPGLGDDITATTKAKLVSVDVIDGREIATIDYSVEIPMALELDLGEMLGQLSGAMGGTDAPSIAFTMGMSGDISFAGTAKVDTADGQTTRMDGTIDMSIEMEITEAPAEMVPEDQRGPFKLDMKATMEMVQK